MGQETKEEFFKCRNCEGVGNWGKNGYCFKHIPKKKTKNAKKVVKIPVL